RQGVVARRGAAQRQPGDPDGDADADVLGGEGRPVTAAVQGDVVVVDDAHEPGVADVERVDGRGVVDLVVGRDPRDRQGLGGDGEGAVDVADAVVGQAAAGGVADDDGVRRAGHRRRGGGAAARQSDAADGVAVD